MHAGRQSLLICAEFGACAWDLRRAARLSQNCSIIQRMRVEASPAYGVPEHCGKRLISFSRVVAHWFTIILFINTINPYSIYPEPGHQPMRQHYISSEYQSFRKIVPDLTCDVLMCLSRNCTRRLRHCSSITGSSLISSITRAKRRLCFL